MRRELRGLAKEAWALGLRKGEEVVWLAKADSPEAPAPQPRSRILRSERRRSP